MTSLESISERWAEAFNRLSELRVAGGLASIAVGDEEVSMAHGIANLNTGQPFTEDTGFLIGSVTKILTTTLIMRLVERGAIELDQPVRRYVPEFTLQDQDAAERITVRMLVNHTNGIDADTLFPWSVRGRDATRAYFDYLPHIGVLFEPGAGIHYTNPGFSIAARVVEVCTGLPFERAIKRELFDPAGMSDATALQTQAFLRRMAIGAVADSHGKSLRATPVFTYGEETVGAGGTPIASVADMLAFGRMHLHGGVAPNGQRILSRDLVQAMRTPTYDLGIPQAPPIGLGWWLLPLAGTTIAWHGGGSPGGSSSFCIIPEHDATVISFATGPGSGVLNDRLLTAAVEALTGQSAVPPLEVAPVPVPEDLAGEYASFQKRLVVEVRDDALVLTNYFEPINDELQEVYEAIWSFEWPMPPVPSTYENIAPGQFMEATVDSASLSGVYARMGLLAALPAGPRRRPGLHQGFRYIPKVG
jgi:CubicO group peptidase (beta-lactamase class C family)